MTRMKKASVVIEGDLITFDTGAHVEGIDISNLTEDIIHHATMHGLKQKIADSYAGLSTETEVHQAIKGVMETLLSGAWNSGRSTSGGIWVEALSRAAGVTLEEAAAKWNAIDEETQKGIKANAAVKQAKAEIELERAKKKATGESIDLDDLV